MSIKLSDYVHYYLGQHVQLPDGATYLLKPSNLPSNFSETSDPVHGKLLLRPLSSMASNEKKDLAIILFNCNEKEYNAFNSATKDRLEEETFHLILGYFGTLSFGQSIKITAYLLKHGFDLFGLIDAGLAIDKTKMLESAK